MGAGEPEASAEEVEAIMSVEAGEEATVAAQVLALRVLAVVLRGVEAAAPLMPAQTRS